MRYKLLIWDFDGTIADSLDAGLEIFNRMAAEHGFLPIHDEALVREMTPVRFIRAHKIPILRIPRLIRGFLARQAERMDSTQLCPGILHVLQDLERQGYRQGIVSSNNELNIRKCLRTHDAERYFSFIAGGAGLFGKKRLLKKVMRQQLVTRNDVLYIGDEIRDVVAGRKLGLDVAAVTWGFNSADILAKNSPTYLLHCPTEISNSIQLSSDNGFAPVIKTDALQ